MRIIFFLHGRHINLIFQKVGKKGVLEGLVLKPFLLLHKGWDNFLFLSKESWYFCIILWFPEVGGFRKTAFYQKT